jgi:hypothetical protein
MVNVPPEAGQLEAMMGALSQAMGQTVPMVAQPEPDPTREARVAEHAPGGPVRAPGGAGEPIIKELRKQLPYDPEAQKAMEERGRAARKALRAKRKARQDEIRAERAAAREEEKERKERAEDLNRLIRIQRISPEVAEHMMREREANVRAQLKAQGVEIENWHEVARMVRKSTIDEARDRAKWERQYGRTPEGRLRTRVDFEQEKSDIIGAREKDVATHKAGQRPKKVMTPEEERTNRAKAFSKALRDTVAIIKRGYTPEQARGAASGVLQLHGVDDVDAVQAITAIAELTARAGAPTADDIERKKLLLELLGKKVAGEDKGGPTDSNFYLPPE